MKKQKYTFNELLVRYNKYLRKLKRLQINGRNEHRQSVLHRHITRLRDKLTVLYISIKGAAAMATVSAMCMVAAPEAKAQIIFKAGVSPAPFGLTDVGIVSTPSFADLDGDGDMDMMSGEADGIFFYFENTGSSLLPAFAAAVSPSPFGLTDNGETSSPTFADLDGDGDMDLMTGEIYGAFSYFENTGSSTAPAFAAAVSPFGLTDVGLRSAPTFVDLDGDGDMDVMAGEGQNGTFHYFENTGSSIAPAFATAVSPAPFGLSDVDRQAAPSFADLDGDGDMDMMAGESDGRFFYFENTGSSLLPAFAAAVSPSPFGLTNIWDSSTPSFADLDGDGNMDLMVGDYYGNFTYFEYNQTPTVANAIPNQNVDEDIALNFQFASNAFEDGDGDAMTYSATLGDDSPLPAWLTFTPATRTLSSMPTNAEVGTIIIKVTASDGALTISDTFDLTVNNINDAPTIANAIADKSIFQDEVFSFQFAADVFNDVDASDVLSYTATLGDDSPLPAWLTFTSGTRTFSGTPTFNDLGTIIIKVTATDDGTGTLSVSDVFDITVSEPLIPIVPLFDAVQASPFGLPDIGISSSPTLGDLDNDGDLDLISGDNIGNFFYFQNTGSSTVPAFAASQQNTFGLVKNVGGSNPTLVDIDNDGDLDLFSGNKDGEIDYFSNTGTAAAPAFGTLQTNPFSIATLSYIGYNSSPTFADLDNDGDLDLISGGKNGNFYYFENTGSITVPAFGTAQANPFGITDIGTRSTASFADLDNDGDFDLMAGEDYGSFFYFENTGSASSPAFKAVVENPFYSSKLVYFSAPTFADLDDDGDLDLLAGEYYGNFHYYKNSPLPVIITWDGETDTDWSTATNWVGDEVPSAGEEVVIPNEANDPVITSNVSVKKIDVQSSASLTINLNKNLTVSDTLKVASGASLIPLGTISGSVTINRTTTFGVSEGKYSIVGSPINNGSTSSLGSIVQKYDETIAYDPLGTAGSTRFIAVNTPETMAVGDAYFTANAGVVSFTGTPNRGDIDVSLVYDESNDGGATDAGFNLVSNPYAAAISYTSFVAGNADMDGTIYLWDDGGSNISERTSADYVTANSIGAASGGSGRSGSWDGYLRSTQGFFVKATTAGTLSFTPSMMDVANNSDAGYFRTENPTVLKFSLSSEKHFNEMLIGFTDDATVDFDRTMDAHKSKGNSNLQFYSKMGNAILAIQALPSVTEETKVDLGFDIAESGIYTLELKEASDYSFEVYLKDNLLDKLIDLSENNTYEFESASVTNSDRFTLVFSPENVLAVDDKLVSKDLIVFSNNGGLNVRMDNQLKNATVKIYNLRGTLVKEAKQVDFTKGDWITSFNEQGLFIITVQSEDQLFIKKFIK